MPEMRSYRVGFKMVVEDEDRDPTFMWLDAVTDKGISAVREWAQTIPQIGVLKVQRVWHVHDMGAVTVI